MNSIPYSRQSIDEEDIQTVVEVLRSDFITQGPRIMEFESALASYCSAKYAVAFSSGTAALHAAYDAAGVGPGDEIITSPITFVATGNAAVYLGARPIFVDVEPDTGNVNPLLIEEAVTEKTRAIVPVHFAGHTVDLDPIREIARKHDLLVIEDACHALGASYKDKKVGALSDMTVFSFHPLKHITTGEGGAVLTDNEEYYDKLLMCRTHGITKDSALFLHESEGDWYHEMQFLGFNYRMTDFQAALGTSQMGKADKFLERRRQIAKTYDAAFGGNPYFDIPVEEKYAHSSYHLYPIRLKDVSKYKKKEIFNGLRERSLGVQVHYIPVYLQPYYQRLGFKAGLCPLSEEFYHKEISIPVYPAMKDEDIQYVIDNIFNVFKVYK